MALGRDGAQIACHQPFPSIGSNYRGPNTHCDSSGVSPTQDTADYEESKGKRGYQHPWGKDEVADTAHGDLYKLLSGVKDPEDEPSKAFDDLKAHLMRAIAPYDLDKVAPVDKERARLYNGVSLSYLTCHSSTVLYVSCSHANSII